MHIPDHIVNQGTSGVGWGLAFTGALLFSLKSLKKSVPNQTEKTSSLALVLLLGMFTFAAQMINVPVLNGISGHLVGMSLMVLLLGYPTALFSMISVLTIQSLLLGDGGLMALGMNIFNMAVLAGIPAVLLKNVIEKSKGLRSGLLVYLTTYGSLVLASLGCSAFVSLSSPSNASQVFLSMTGIHLVAGFVEAGITTILYFGLLKGISTSHPKKTFLFPSSLAVVTLILLSPLSSKLPDGLEWTLNRFGMEQFSHVTSFVPVMEQNIFSHAGTDWANTIIGALLGSCAIGLLGAGFYLFKNMKIKSKSIQ